MLASLLLPFSPVFLSLALQCHAEQCPDHPLKRTTEMVFICKKCRKCFRKDMTDFDPETDEYCPHCDNHFVVDAITPKKKVLVEVEGDVEMIANRDPRVKRKEHTDLL